jgi:hypothetical protein
MVTIIRDIYPTQISMGFVSIKTCAGSAPHQSVIGDHPKRGEIQRLIITSPIEIHLPSGDD